MLQDIGLFAVTESQFIEDEHDDEDEDIPNSGVTHAIRWRDLAKVSKATASTIMMPIMICWM